MKQNTTHGTQVGFPSKPESQETKHQGDEAWAVEDGEIESSPAWPPTEWLDPRLRVAPTLDPPPPWGGFPFTQPSGSLLRAQKKGEDSCHTQGSGGQGLPSHAGVRWAGGPYIAPLELPVLLLGQDLIHHCRGFPPLADVLPLLEGNKGKGTERGQRGVGRVGGVCALLAQVCSFSTHSTTLPSRNLSSWMWGSGWCP